MGLSDTIGNLLQQYTGNATPPAAAAQGHFDQVAQGVDHSTLSSGISSMIRSPDTPDFGNIVGQLFANASPEQKASMLNSLLAGASPAVLSQVSALVPGLAAGATVSPAQTQAINPAAVTQVATSAAQSDPSIVDKVSSIFATHPTLVKTLGPLAMIVALREIAKRFTP